MSNYQKDMKNLQMKVCGKQQTNQNNLNNMSQLFAYYQGMYRLQKKKQNVKRRRFWENKRFIFKNLFSRLWSFLKCCRKFFCQNHACSFTIHFIILVLLHIFYCLCSSSTCRFENMSHISLPITISTKNVQNPTIYMAST